MAHQHEISQLLSLDLPAHVLHLLRMVDLLVHTMAVAEHGGCEHPMTQIAQPPADRFPVRTGMPGAMNQYEVDHHIPRDARYGFCRRVVATDVMAVMPVRRVAS